MSSNRRSGDGGSRPGGMALGRAVLLLVVAVVIGVVVLHKNGGSHPVSVASSTASTAAPAPGTTTVAPRHTATTSATARPPSQVVTLVANGTHTAGAGARITSALQRAGYNVLSPTNASSPASSSSVFFTAGYDREAVAVAGILGLGPSTVQPVPTHAPVANTRNANVLVVIGPDLASQSGPSSATSSTAASH